MAKKRKAGGQAFNSTKAVKAEEQSSQGSRSATKVQTGVFCHKSSLGVPFLVVSNQQLVANLPTPTAEEWKELLALCSNIVKFWDSRKAVVLADFEGECTGLEGELVSACFQRTLSLDQRSLRPIAGGGVCRDMGLLVDLRCKEGIALTKRIMESEASTKAIWGADGDVKSLCYTPLSTPMGIRSTAVLDVQLAYSSPGRRLAMGNMLKRVPAKMLEKLPKKGDIDFGASHAFHRRALPLPFDARTATYAVDDLHRIDAILLSKKPPPPGSYMQASGRSSAQLNILLQAPAGGSLDRLRQYQSGMQREGTERTQKLKRAVSIKRHVMALRRLDPDSADGEEFKALEAEAGAILEAAGVSIPEDLCFGAYVAPEVPSAAEGTSVALQEVEAEGSAGGTEAEDEEPLLKAAVEEAPGTRKDEEEPTAATAGSAGKKKRKRAASTGGGEDAPQSAAKSEGSGQQEAATETAKSQDLEQGAAETETPVQQSQGEAGGAAAATPASKAGKHKKKRRKQ